MADLKPLFTASLVLQDKYELTGVLDPGAGRVVLAKLERISDQRGRFSEERLIKKAQAMSQKGGVVLIEDSPNSLVGRNLNTILLQDQDRGSGRVKRDLCFEQFMRAYQSGKVTIDPGINLRVPVESEYRIRVDANGKTLYEFEEELGCDLRAVLLMASFLYARPMDSNFIEEMFGFDGGDEEEDPFLRTIQSLYRSEFGG